MSRQKKNKSIQVEEKQEVVMSEAQTLESLEQEIDKARQELEKTKIEIEEKKQELKFNHLSKKEQEISERHEAAFVKRDALKEKIEKQKAFDNEMVTGRFRNLRVQGQAVKLTYMKYEDDPVKWYNFEDGKVYTIPRGFADQINEHYYTPHFVQKAGEMDPDRPASAIHAVDTSNKKYAFVPLNF